MFRHILVATDGTAPCNEAVRNAAALAHADGARLTALNVRPFDHVHYPQWHDGSAPSPEEKAFRRRTEADCEAALEAAKRAAAAEGVACEHAWAESDAPWQVILDTAHAKGCDLIVMAHHLRKGLDAVLAESQTQEVLAHSSIPVLVTRRPA